MAFKTYPLESGPFFTKNGVKTPKIKFVHFDETLQS